MRIFIDGNEVPAESVRIEIEDDSGIVDGDGTCILDIEDETLIVRYEEAYNDSDDTVVLHGERHLSSVHLANLACPHGMM